MAGTEQPNILLIMVDQLIPQLTGAYGHPVVQTPHIDALARRGVRFDSAYSPCPLCAPARASFVTGQYMSRIGCYDNASPLAPDEPTFAHYLAAAGYDTALSGKMHFIGPDQLHGFARRLTSDIYPADFHYLPSRQPQTAPRFPDSPHASMYALPKVGVAKWSMYLDYDEETLFRALQYIRDRRVTAGDANRAMKVSGEGSGRESIGAQPFCLSVSFHHPHEPFIVTQRLWDMYEGEPIDIPQFPANLQETYSEMDRWLNVHHGCDWVANLKDPKSLYALRRAYYGLVSYVDEKVGQLLAALHESGLGDNTVVISEYHSAGVYAPCFMLRVDRYKFVYIHGHDEQLFDLDNDPGEWRNLAGEADYRALSADLRGRILSRFDPEAIEADIQRRLPKRKLVRETMHKLGVHWDYTPDFDDTRRWVR